MRHGISHESLEFSRFTHEPLTECGYQEMRVTSGTIHGTPRESVGYLFYIMPKKIQWLAQSV